MSKSNDPKNEFRIMTGTQLTAEENARIAEHSAHVQKTMAPILKDSLIPAVIVDHPRDTQERIEAWGSLVMEYGRKIQYEIYRRHRYGDKHPEAHEVTGDPKKLREVEKKFLTSKKTAPYPHDIATWQATETLLRAFEKHGHFHGISYEHDKTDFSDENVIAAVKEMKAAAETFHKEIDKRSEITDFSAPALTASLLKAGQRQQHPPLSRLRAKAATTAHRRVRIR